MAITHELNVSHTGVRSKIYIRTTRSFLHASTSCLSDFSLSRASMQAFMPGLTRYGCCRCRCYWLGGTRSPRYEVPSARHGAKAKGLMRSLRRWEVDTKCPRTVLNTATSNKQAWPCTQTCQRTTYSTYVKIV